MLALLAASAAAHTRLAESVPAHGAQLIAAPQHIELTFSEAVRLTALTIRRQGGSAQEVGPLPSEPATDFLLSAPRLDAGEYLVSWRALSSDTHVMTGEFAFSLNAQAGQ
jgi:methionine-rich copper-binding protein CopC